MTFPSILSPLSPASLRLCAISLFLMLFSGCLVTPVSESGGMGTDTVTNSNPGAIIAAAQSVFPNYGYTPTFGGDGITSVCFDKNSNKVANVLWGSYGDPQTLHVKVKIVRIPGTNNYRITPKVSTISDAGEAGFESKHKLGGLWASQFGPLMRQVAARASGAGPQ